MRDNNPIAAAAGLILAVALATSGCSEDPQERYERAVEGLQQARAARAAAREEVRDKKAELARLQDKLDAAQRRLEQAREQLEKAAAQVDESVNDEVLFRSIQRDLLDKNKFGDAAIAVGVEGRVVTLTGTVPDQATRKMALDVARDHPGVEKVVDFLDIEGQSEQADRNNPQPEKKQ